MTTTTIHDQRIDQRIDDADADDPRYITDEAAFWAEERAVGATQVAQLHAQARAACGPYSDAALRAAISLVEAEVAAVEPTYVPLLPVAMSRAELEHWMGTICWSAEPGPAAGVHALLAEAAHAA